MDSQTNHTPAMARFDHCNLNVSDLARAIKFYAEALGLSECGRIEGPEGAFTIAYLTDGITEFRLELTWLRDHPQPYELGENESHIAFRAPSAQAYEDLHKHHKEMGVICYENEAMGIYFTEDPDGYWLEIIPPRR